MPRIDAFGVRHITGTDTVTRESDMHLICCAECAAQFPMAARHALERGIADG